MKNTYHYNIKRVYDYIANLTGQQSGIRTEVLEAMNAGQMEINSKSLYVRKSIDGASNTVRLIDQSDDHNQGLRNITGAQLPQDNYFFIEGVRLAFSSSSSDPKAVSNYTTLRTAWDPALYAGQTRIGQRGRKLLEIENHLFTAGASSDATAQEEAYALPDIRHLLPLQKIDLEIEFAEGDSVAGANCVELTLIGRQLEVKA